ncbi:MAG TPA: hypothetical protein VFQ30_09630 [Ktedonobacteraceae bacterium]|nr:hypothetical protein [Ktedonobacteraceae bacterium]
MSETKEQKAVESSQLNRIIDDLFGVFEEIHRLLCSWKPSYHTAFIEQCIRLQQLESDLSMLGYDEDFVLNVKQIVYRSVFGSSNV